jgi:hypothetical protein
MMEIVKHVLCPECDTDIPIAFNANDGGGMVFTYCSKCENEFAVSIAVSFDLRISRLEFN